MKDSCFSRSRRVLGYGRRGALLLALSGLAAAANGQNFTQSSTPSTGPGSDPAALVLADVNGDGKLDVLTANGGNHTLGVLLGDGAGGFVLQPGAAPTGASGTVRHLAVADVNGDGKLDALTLTTAGAYSGTVSVLLGNGAGGFVLQPNSPSAGDFPDDLAVGDVSGDGKPDVVTIDTQDDLLNVLVGDGAGGFVPAAPLALTYHSMPSKVRLLDVNGDGKLDIVTADFYTSGLTVLLGDGAGSFALRGSSAGYNDGPVDVALADVNGDGKLDALTANFTSNQLRVLLGDGKGYFTFQDRSIWLGYNCNPRRVAVADVNADGQPDALVTGAYGLQVLLGDGTGNFFLQGITYAGGSSLGLADVSGDGKPDVVETGGSPTALRVLLNTAPAPLNNSTNNALALAGMDACIRLPGSLASGAQEFTFEAWVNYQPAGNLVRVFDFGSSLSKYLLLTPSAADWGGASAGHIGFAITTGGEAAEQHVSTTTTMPSGWHHLAVTLGKSGATTTGTLYLDGEVIGTNPGLTLTPASLGPFTANPFNANWLGCSRANGNGLNPALQGALDEVRVYSTALTPADIRADRFSTTAAVPGSLLAYYDFDQNTPGGNNAGLVTLLDRSGHGYHGLLGHFNLDGGATTLNWVRSFPTLTGLAPGGGAAGSRVTLTGTNLKDVTAFKFNGTAVAPFTTPTTDLTTTVTVPAGTTAGPVSLTAANLTLYNGSAFTLVLAATPALVAAGVALAPNPAHGSFVVEVPAVAGASTVQAELLNVLGQVVRRQSAALPAAGATLTVPTADLAPGPYLLRLQAGATALTKRVLVY